MDADFNLEVKMTNDKKIDPQATKMVAVRLPYWFIEIMREEVREGRYRSQSYLIVESVLEKLNLTK